MGTTTGDSVAPCTTIGADRQQPAMISAYVLDPSTNLLNQSVLVPFDYDSMGTAFGVAVTIVLTFWLIAKPIGMMLGLVSRNR